LGKLKTLSGTEVCRILEAHSFEKVRQRGSHIVMQKQTSEGTVTVPVPDHKEIRRGTLMSIIRQSSVQRSEFE
jgi:predicted RNA binding protein YcfA (HicA-like mRNA interferase family)